MRPVRNLLAWLAIPLWCSLPCVSLPCVSLPCVSLPCVSLLCVSLLGVSLPSCTLPGNRPRELELAAYLRGCDPCYSEATRMLGRKAAGPGYHTQVPAGAWVHPTLDSLDYALALLERGATDDVARAASILDAVLDLQATDRRHDFYGVWPWLQEESLEQMAPPDRNWADFCGARLAQVLVDHPGRLDVSLERRIRLGLLHAARAIQTRDVSPGYTNIAIMGAGVTVTAGELLDDNELVEYGRDKLRAVLAAAGPQENFEEYNSPTYTMVVLLECERALHKVRDPQTRATAERLRGIAWRTIAESFHPATAQWAGPHSRAYTDRLAAWQTAALARRVGCAIAVHPDADNEHARAFDPTPALPCPAELRDRFRARPAPPLELRRTFYSDDKDPREPRRDRIGTTWIDGDASLGSINRAALWAQRRPVLAYWRTDRDPAVVLRLRALHDGRDFAALGVHSVQRANRVLCLFYLLSERGDWHRHLDPPEGGIYRARDLRIRWELRGAGVTVRTLAQARFELGAGRHRALIHAPTGRFFDAPVEWRTGSTAGLAYVEALLHAGAERGFDFGTTDAIRLATALELRTEGDRRGSPGIVLDAPSMGCITATWGGLRGATPTLVADGDR